jgi:hypothetical protein
MYLFIEVKLVTYTNQYTKTIQTRLMRFLYNEQHGYLKTLLLYISIKHKYYYLSFLHKKDLTNIE